MQRDSIPSPPTPADRFETAYQAMDQTVRTADPADIRQRERDQAARARSTGSPFISDQWDIKAARIHGEPSSQDAPSMMPVLVLASLTAVIVFVVCLAMRPSEQEQWTAAVDHSLAQFDETIDALSDGRQPQELAGPPADPWPVRNPALAALAPFVAILVVGRVYIFMRRLEER